MGGAYPRLRNDVGEIMVLHRYDAWAAHAADLMTAARTASAPHIATVKAFTDALGDHAAEVLAIGDESEAMERVGADNLTRYALARDAVRKLDRLRDLVRQINRLTGHTSYTYVGALVWADLTYEQERELFARFRRHLADEGKLRPNLSVWHVLLGGYTPEFADGAEFTRRSDAFLAAHNAAQEAARSGQKREASFH